MIASSKLLQTANRTGDQRDGSESDTVHDADQAAAVTDIRATDWVFLANYFLEWLDISSCDYAFSPTPESRSFGSFAVHATGGVKELVRMWYITQLVACMLHVDPEAWWFLRASERQWFSSFDPTAYDQTTLIPKMTFTPRIQVGTTAADTIDGVSRLYDMLLATNDEITHAFEVTKTELIKNHDPNNKLRDFILPIGLEFCPEDPQTSEALQLYLRSVVELVQALQQRQPASGSEYTFRLEDISLMLYRRHLDSVREELRTLLSFGVPVNVRLRRISRHYRDTFICPESKHIYAALAENPSPVGVRVPRSDAAMHKLEQREVDSSSELWSAVAFAPSLRDLAVRYEFSEDRDARVNQVKWLSFALRNGSLRSLVLDQFEPRVEDMAAFREIAESSDPVRLLAFSAQPGGVQIGDGPQIVAFKTNAVIKIACGEVKTLRELGIGADWRLPVVAIHSKEERIEFVVPGYAICSVSMSDVASIDTVAPAPTLLDRGDVGLRTLQVTNWYQRQSGLAVRFVEVYGRSLRELRWNGNENWNFAGDRPSDEDLEAVLPSCPHLESLEIQHRRLYSLQMLVQHYESPSFCLRKLKLTTTPVPPQELVQFFNHLSNPHNRLTKTLESLEFVSFTDNYADDFVDVNRAFCCVNVAVIDAALAMLRTNRTLSYFCLGISHRYWEAHSQRFDAEKGVRVQTSKRLPVRERLAFVSVVQSTGNESALQRLDNGCVLTIFDFLTHATIRQVIIEKKGYEALQD